MNNKKNDIDVDYVAKLARLKIPDFAKEQIQCEMTTIVNYVNLLSELELKDISPTMHAADMVNVWREDFSEKKEMKNLILDNAPQVVDLDLVKVPQVLPGEGMA